MFLHPHPRNAFEAKPGRMTQYCGPGITSPNILKASHIHSSLNLLMSLESGTYQIKSTPSGDTIGRDLIENRSFSPKAIVVQSSGSGFETVNTHWEIECWDKCYYLKIGGAAAGVLDGESSGEVVAIIKERFGGSSREWILRPTAGIGEGEGEGDVYQ
jgi:hypothetical protein